MIDDYLISYLSVGRDVLRFMTASAGQPGDPLVAADPDFDLIGSGMPSPTATITEQVRRQSRDLDRGSLRFERLRGTRVEGERIAAALGVPPLLQQEVLEAASRPHAPRASCISRRTGSSCPISHMIPYRSRCQSATRRDGRHRDRIAFPPGDWRTLSCARGWPWRGPTPGSSSEHSLPRPRTAC